MLKNTTFLSLFVILILFVGCGKAGPAVNPVSGTVTLDGQPLTDASIRFTPKGEGEAAAGSTNASGNLAGIKTLSTGTHGIVAGEYTVTISKMISKPSKRTYTVPETGEVVKMTTSEEMVPKNFTLIEKSPVSVSIKKGENKLTLEFKK
ncbi:hypothetical protein FACS18942_03980 [Planctomycetales bacterium]|nr:hypothetical protein FACS18942_03980 [Planctomycetales bacterium]